MLPITLEKNKSVEALINSGAQSCYMSNQLVREIKAPIRRLFRPKVVWNVDGTRNKSKAMAHYMIIPIQIGNLKYRQLFYIVAIGKQQMILGFKWLKKIKPDIQWDPGRLTVKHTPEDLHDHWIRSIADIDARDDHECIKDIYSDLRLLEPPKFPFCHRRPKSSFFFSFFCRNIELYSLFRTLYFQERNSTSFWLAMG